MARLRGEGAGRREVDAEEANLSWATFVVLAVSSGLGLIGPVMQRTLKT